MKNKKLLIIIAVVVGVIALVVILAACFSVHSVNVVFFNADGSKYIIPSADSGAPSSDDVMKVVGGKSVFGINKQNLMTELNTRFHGYIAVAVRISFPDKLTVAFVPSEICAKLSSVTKEVIYLDSMGNIVEHKDGANAVDISSAFRTQTIADITVGKPLVFANEIDNVHLKQVLTAVNAMWRCYLDYDDIPAILGESNVFGYKDGDLTITIKNTATIILKSPEKGDLGERVIRGLSVYFKSDDNMQNSGTVIIVSPDGSVREEKSN